MRIEETDVVFGEQQVMHANVAGDRQAVVLRPLHQGDTGRRGNPGQMDAATGVTHELDDGGDGDGFGRHRNASQTEAAGNFTFVRDAVAR